MPELPEVETIRRQLCGAGICGKTIEKVSISWPRTVEPLSPPAFRKKVADRTIERISRHGKWLIFELGRDRSPNGPQTARRSVPTEDNLLVHLRMTGGFSFEPGSYDRVVFHLSGGEKLYFRDPRKFGRMRLGAFPLGLGPDALEMNARIFFQSLETCPASGRKTNRMLKPVLLDQSFIAGVGNIYADEALFAARLHPQRRASSLTDDEKLALYMAVTSVIRAAVENGGTSLGGGQGNYRDLNGNSGGHREKTKVYGRAGQPCVECAAPLKKIIVAQRTTVFCPHCQK